jgi:hypothetical protein
VSYPNVIVGVRYRLLPVTRHQVRPIQDRSTDNNHEDGATDGQDSTEYKVTLEEWQDIG